MKIDSLTKFDELVNSGIPQDQARVLAHGLCEASEIDLNIVATKEDIRILEKDLMREIRHISKVMYIFGGAMFVVVCVPILERLFIKLCG